MESREARLLLVDDDPSAIRALSRILSAYPDQRFATSGEVALRLASEAVPDLILLDAEMPGMSGFQFFEAVKALPATANVPVIFVTSHTDTAFEVAGLEMGAADFISKPVSAPLLLARVKAQLRVKSMADDVRLRSTIDGVTGVHNRRAFDDALLYEWLHARRAGNPISLIILDIDHFKLYNDLYGHPAGDACLRTVAQALAADAQRPTDLLARYGGEEFALLLPLTSRRGAEHLARRLVRTIARLELPHDASPTAPHLTVSAGASYCDDASVSWVRRADSKDVGSDCAVRASADELVSAADKALYAAKHAGRAQAMLLDIADVNDPSRAWRMSDSDGIAAHRTAPSVFDTDA
jgi:diguanylate cyclase (GGDEF)-like protein